MYKNQVCNRIRYESDIVFTKRVMYKTLNTQLKLNPTPLNFESDHPSLLMDGSSRVGPSSHGRTREEANPHGRGTVSFKKKRPKLWDHLSIKNKPNHSTCRCAHPTGCEWMLKKEKEKPQPRKRERASYTCLPHAASHIPILQILAPGHHFACKPKKGEVRERE